MTAERTPERAIRAAALRRDLMRRMELGNLDEILVLDQHWQRIELGRDRYGLLDLRQARDWDREELEEHLDAATYRACERVQRREREREASFHLDNTPGDAPALKVSTQQREVTYGATGEIPAQSAVVATASEQDNDRRVDLDTARKYTAPVDDANALSANDPGLTLASIDGNNSDALALLRESSTERKPRAARSYLDYRFDLANGDGDGGD